MKATFLPLLLILSITSIGLSDMLRFSFDDPLGDQTSTADLTGMDVTFDDSTGDFEILFTASASNPFFGDFVFNINLYNPDTVGGTAQDPAFFQHYTDPILIHLSTAVESLAFTGTNSRLMSWEVGDKVASANIAFGPPEGSSEFRTRVYDYPVPAEGGILYDLLSNGEEYYTTIEAVPVPVPSAVLLGIIGIGLAAKKIKD